jgi:cell division septum initiation protein DivIVA
MTAETFNVDAALPTALRGYAREPVDAMLEDIERTYRALLAERDELRSGLANANKRLSEVTAELENHAAQKKTVAETLGEAGRLQESNRGLSAERDELRAALAKATERLSQLEAELERYAGREREVVDALIETERLRSAGQSDIRALKEEATREIAELRGRAEERQHQAEDLLDDARAKLSSLVRDLFDRVGERPEQDVSVGTERSES